MLSPCLLLLLLLVQPAPAAQPAQARPEPEVQMTTYQMVFLYKGPSPEPQGAAGQEMQAAHLEYLRKLNAERKNLLYGPYTDGGDPVGLAVFDVPDAEAARTLMASDPYVKSGALRIEVKPWMGPKGWFKAPPVDDPTQPGALEPFIFGILVRGPNRSQPQAEAEEIQKGHLAYMDSLYREGKLPMAGPFFEDGDWRGVVVYRVKTVEDARELAAGDPAVKAGRLKIEVRPWMTLRGILK